MAKKPPLPPKSLSRGDTVRIGEMMGVISGDHLSPGGMQGYLEVTFFVTYYGDAGLRTYVRRIQVAKEKLTPVVVPHIPFDSTAEGDMSQAAGFVEYDIQGEFI